MPRKNKEEYNEYMRNYMKSKDQAKRSVKQETEPEQFDPNQGTEPLPPDLMKLGKTLVDSQADKGDKTFGMIQKVMEYAPTVIGLVQQFAKGMADSQMANAQQSQPQAPPPQPPPFYGTPKAVQYLDDPNWIAQRDAWLSYQAGRPITQAPQNMAQHYQQEQRVQQRQGLPPQQERLTMEQLNREATADLKPVEAEPQGIPNEEREHDPRLQIENKPQVEQVTQEQKDLVIEEMRKDNEKAVGLVVGWINGQSDADLKKRLEQEEPFKEAYPFVEFMPIQYRDMIATLDADQVFTILEGGCPAKMKLVKELKKVDHLKKAWTQLQAKITG